MDPTTDALVALRRELARGTTELVALSVLGTGRRYGYELLKLLQAHGGEVIEIKEGTLYPLLHRLEAAGHITGEWCAEGRERPRKYYALTQPGRAHLHSLRREWETLIRKMQKLIKSFEEVQP